MASPHVPSQGNILRLLRMLRPMRAQGIGQIRLGCGGDGGYVLDDALVGIRDAISIGIGSDVSFDLDLADRGVTVHQYDHTVEGPPATHPNFRFHRTAWAAEDDAGGASLATMIKLADSPHDLLL